jgi:basic amino acid/polyamine antiporter, APA family
VNPNLVANSKETIASSAVTAAQRQPELVRELNAWHATAIVAGTIIGSGIFLVPKEMMQAVGTAKLVYLVWIVGGVLSFAGALTYAELGAIKPWAGGEYVYIRDAYGPLPGFLYCWTWFLIAKPASIASITSGLVRILGNFSWFGFLPHSILHMGSYVVTWGQILAIAATVLISALNYLGVRKAGNFQLAFTVLKVLMIAVIIGAGFSAANGSWSNFATTFTGARGGMAGFMVALVAALWAYDGWNDLNMVSGEIKNPERSIPVALIAGVALVAVLYIGVNGAVQYVMPAVTVASSPVPASTATQIAIGSTGALLVSAGMALSLLVTLNGTIMSGGRIPFALARDGYFFKALAEVHPRFHTPSLAIVVQAILAILLLLGGGGFKDFIELAIFAEWLFYMIAASTIFVFRAREPNLQRPYRVWGYPVVPALFVICAAVLLYYTFLDKLHTSVVGTLVMTGVIMAGVPVYWWFAKRKRAV